MYPYSCVCGKSTMNFKFDIGGPFTGECCALAVLEEAINAQIDGTLKTDDEDNNEDTETSVDSEETPVVISEDGKVEDLKDRERG